MTGIMFNPKYLVSSDFGYLDQKITRPSNKDHIIVEDTVEDLADTAAYMDHSMGDTDHFMVD
ncbi:hypothetical protein MAR_037967 [Mya arenaria]|uniref:Uncharacterized protein n=1 Tax=Mya arenaria TaxID=6604 RepID=A0ABY7FQ03_MYAAR|nr:hypothetical protein MAR_037967 [Mya arenaria]